MVHKIWLAENSGITPMERWQARICSKHLTGWAKHTSGVYKNKNKMDMLDSLDKKATHCPNKKSI
jgi:hypothetical protein